MQENNEGGEKEVQKKAKDIFADSAVVDLENHKAAYRTGSYELEGTYGYEEWIAIQKLDKGNELYSSRWDAYYKDLDYYYIEKRYKSGEYYNKESHLLLMTIHRPLKRLRSCIKSLRSSFPWKTMKKKAGKMLMVKKELRCGIFSRTASGSRRISGVNFKQLIQ